MSAIPQVLVACGRTRVQKGAGASATWEASSSRSANLLRAQIGHPELAQELLLSTDAGLMLLLRGCDALLVLHG